MLTLTEKIQTALIGSKNMSRPVMAENLSSLIGKEVSLYDSCIDDGADGDETEDQYVMRDCWSTVDDSVVIRIYYGDVSREIGYVDVAEVAV